MTTGVECRRLDFPCPSCKRAFAFSNSRVDRSLTADASIHAGFSVKTVPQGGGARNPVGETQNQPFQLSGGVLFSSYFPLAPSPALARSTLATRHCFLAWSVAS